MPGTSPGHSPWVAMGSMTKVTRAVIVLGALPRPLNVTLLRALWSPLAGFWGLLKGSCYSYDSSVPV